MDTRLARSSFHPTPAANEPTDIETLNSAERRIALVDQNRLQLLHVSKIEKPAPRRFCGLIPISNSRDKAAAAAIDGACAFHSHHQWIPMAADTIPATNKERTSATDIDLLLANPEKKQSLERTASFLNITPQIGHIDRLLTADITSAGPLSDYQRNALEASLHTIKANAANVKLAAIEKAESGGTILPLALDYERFQAFLQANDHNLQAVVSACSGMGANSAADTEIVKQAIQSFGENYLRQTGKLPSGIDTKETASSLAGNTTTRSTPPLMIQFSNMSVGTESKTYAVGSHQNQDMAAITLHQKLLTQNPDMTKHRLAGFAAHPAHAQRAAVILHTAVGCLVDIEMLIATRGLRVKTIAEKRLQEGTAAEANYTGSVEVGDACSVQTSAPSQRTNILQPILRFKKTAESYQAHYGKPLITDDALKNWVGSTNLPDDLRSTLCPASRLRIAQFKSTADLLLKTSAFRNALENC